MPSILTHETAASHIARANEAARNCPDAFGRALWLAQASARVRSERFWPALTALHKGFLSGRRHPIVNGKEMRDVFSLSAKWEGICYNWQNRADIHAAVFGADTEAEALAALTEKAQWLSTVKGGFVIQLTRGGIGCIDAVNRRLYGIGNVTSSVPKYVALCDSLGGSVALWAAWCNAVALERGTDPVAISEAHCAFIETGEAEPLTFGN